MRLLGRASICAVIPHSAPRRASICVVIMHSAPRNMRLAVIAVKGMPTSGQIGRRIPRSSASVIQFLIDDMHVFKDPCLPSGVIADQKGHNNSRWLLAVHKEDVC